MLCRVERRNETELPDALPEEVTLLSAFSSNTGIGALMVKLTASSYFGLCQRGWKLHPVAPADTGVRKTLDAISERLINCAIVGTWCDYDGSSEALECVARLGGYPNTEGIPMDDRISQVACFLDDLGVSGYISPDYECPQIHPTENGKFRVKCWVEVNGLPGFEGL